MIIGCRETIPKAEAIKGKRLCTFVNKCLHSEEMFNEFKGYLKIGRTNVNAKKRK